MKITKYTLEVLDKNPIIIGILIIGVRLGIPPGSKDPQLESAKPTIMNFN